MNTYTIWAHSAQSQTWGIIDLKYKQTLNQHFQTWVKFLQ